MGKENYCRQEGPWSDADVLLLCSNTGSWRTERPIVDQERCIYCGFCALYCPVQCMADMKEYYQADLEFCKGCGMCAKECPRKAIVMKPEGEFK